MYCVKDKLPPYNEEEDVQTYWGYYIVGNIDSYDNIEDIETEYGFVSYYGNNIWKDNHWKNVQVLYWGELLKLPDNHEEYFQELFKHRYDKFTVVLFEYEYYYVDLNSDCKKRTMYPIPKYNENYHSIGSIVLNEQGLPCKVIQQDPIVLQELEYISHKEYLKIIKL